MSDAPLGLLTVDCGNSTLDCLFHPSGARLVLDSRAPDEGRLGGFLQVHQVTRCVAVSVVPDGLLALTAASAARGIPLQVAGRELPCPLRLEYDTPRTLGADRWVGALAAFRRYGRSIVVDCGTATTVNLVDGDGVFRGGSIAPGLGALVTGLAVAAPALPIPRLDAEPAVPPRNTQSAIDTGVLLGYCGLVERLVSATLRAARGPAQVVLTGGHAARLLRHTNLHPVHVPDLVHQGLRALVGATP